MTINKYHPQFRPELELLLILPKHPVSVRQSEIIEDLALKHHPYAEIHALAGMLERDGIQCRFDRVGRIGFVSIMPDSWDLAQRLAELYWERVYESVN